MRWSITGSRTRDVEGLAYWHKAHGVLEHGRERRMRWRRMFWGGSGCRSGRADMKNLRYDNEQCQSVAYEKALPELLRQLRQVAVERRPECCLDTS